MKNNTILLLIIIVTLFAKCRGIDGEIEIRQNRAYLVNLSREKGYKFTVKTVENINDSTFDYSTKIIELAPGDEVLLGYVKRVRKKEYPEVYKTFFKTYPFDYTKNYEITKADNKLIKKDPADEFLSKNQEKDEVIHARDTILNNVRMKYSYVNVYFYDSLHPYPQDIYKYSYKVTGQSLLK